MLKYLIKKEFLQIRRNAFLPRLIVIFPIVIMCVMPWVMQMEVKNVIVDVVDIDHTVESQRLIQQIAASNYFIAINTADCCLQLLYFRWTEGYLCRGDEGY